MTSERIPADLLACGRLVAMAKLSAQLGLLRTDVPVGNARRLKWSQRVVIMIGIMLRISQGSGPMTANPIP